MAINKKLIHFDMTKQQFMSNANGLNNQTKPINGIVGNIPYYSVVFLKDGYIWTHGHFINGTGIADSVSGNATISWSKITDKPNTFTPSAHTQAYTTLTGSGTTANQAIVSSGTTNGWVLKTLGSRAFDNTNYLPLAGGTMSGTAVITFADSGNWGKSNKGVTFPLVRGGFYWSGQSDWISLKSIETTSDNLDLVLQFGDDNSNGLSVRNKDDTQVARINASGIISATSFVKNGGLSSQFLKADGSIDSTAYLPLSGGTMTGAINLTNTNAKIAFGSLSTSPITSYKAPSLGSNGVGIYSRYGGNSDEGAIIITEDTCVIYNSADTGWNFQVMDKDLGTDMTADATRSFGVNQDHQAFSLGGFVKSGSDNNHVLLGGGGHKAVGDFATSGHNHNSSYVASVSISGNNLRINKNGSNSDLTIPYATNADMVDNVHLENILTYKNSIGNRTQNNHNFHSALKLGVYEMIWGGYIANHPSDWEDGSNHFGQMLHFGGDNHGYILLDRSTQNMYFKNIGGTSSYGEWYKVLHSSNYTDYTVTKTGSGASGTWGINISGNADTATNADKLDGYHCYSFHLRGSVIDTHAEGENTIILGFENELFAFYKRGCTCTAYEVTTNADLTKNDLSSYKTGTTYPKLNENIFNGLNGYNQDWSYNGDNLVVFDLTMPTHFWSPVFFWSFGSGAWKPAKLRILSTDTRWSDNSYNLKYSSDSAPAYGKVFVGGQRLDKDGDNANGVNKLRIVCSKFSRISQFGITDYFTQGLSTVYLSRTIDNSIYRSFTPAADNTYTIGTSSLRWKEVCAVNLYGSLTGNATSATKATQDSDGNRINTTYIKKGGNQTACPDGTAITGPGGANILSIRTEAASGRDVGIFQLSDDNAYICNSSDDCYTFAVFDTDLTQNFASEDTASFCVQSNGAGCKIRGNTVIHSGNIGSQSVNYATNAGKATNDSDGNTINTTYAKLGAHNNLIASDNEFTFASSGFSGGIYLNYRTAGGMNGNITKYILGNGKGGTLGTVIHTGNIGSQSVASATKLQTARTLWGQSFDGTGNVSGNMSGVGSITASGNNIITKSNTEDISFAAKNNNGQIELLTSTNRGVYNRTNSTWLIATNGTNTFLSNGNVGIGTTSPSYKLDVNGTLHASGATTLSSTLYVGNNATIAGTLGVYGTTTLKSATTITANTYISGETYFSAVDAFRLNYGSYGIIHRNDGGSYWILLTNKNEQNGGFNSLRPFHIDLSTGTVYMDNNAIIDNLTFTQCNISMGGRVNATWGYDLNTNDYYGLYFKSKNSSSTGILFNDDGNVGIGTTSPQRKLHVIGEAIFGESGYVASQGTGSGYSGTWVGTGFMELSSPNPYIDFHGNKSTADYTSRLIQWGDKVRLKYENSNATYNGYIQTCEGNHHNPVILGIFDLKRSGPGSTIWTLDNICGPCVFTLANNWGSDVTFDSHTYWTIPSNLLRVEINGTQGDNYTTKSIVKAASCIGTVMTRWINNQPVVSNRSHEHVEGCSVECLCTNKAPGTDLYYDSNSPGKYIYITGARPWGYDDGDNGLAMDQFRRTGNLSYQRVRFVVYGWLE